jgi:polysaccharide pyruvyl transferase WcaK-like protein
MGGLHVPSLAAPAHRVPADGRPDPEMEPAKGVRSALRRLLAHHSRVGIHPTPAAVSTTPVKIHEPRRILLLGLFGCGNYGNDGSLETMLGTLRAAFPHVDLVCASVNPAKVEATFGIRGLQIDWPGFSRPKLEVVDRVGRKVPRRLMNWVRTIRHVRRFDAVIVPGTGCLNDYRADPFGAPYWFFRWCVAAKLCGVKLCLVDIGAGPISHPLSRWMLKQVVKSASYLSFRDAASREFVAGLGVNTPADGVYPDIVFGLPFEPRPPPHRPVGRRSTVGVGVMWYDGWQGQRRPDESVYTAYLARIHDFVSWLLARGHPVRLLVGEATDERVVAQLTARADRAREFTAAGADLTAEPINSLQDLMREIAQTDIVVASRYHNLVCALKLARPTISIGYSIKHDQLMDRVGLSTFRQDIEQLSLPLLLEQFEELSTNRSLYEAQIGTHMIAFRRRLAQQDRNLLRALTSQEDA